MDRLLFQSDDGSVELHTSHDAFRFFLDAATVGLKRSDADRLCVALCAALGHPAPLPGWRATEYVRDETRHRIYCSAGVWVHGASDFPAALDAMSAVEKLVRSPETLEPSTEKST